MQCIDVASLLRASCQPACFTHTSLQQAIHLPADISPAPATPHLLRPQRHHHRHHRRATSALDPPAAQHPSQRALLLQLVCPYLPPLGRACLRLTCSDGRLAANAAVTAADFPPNENPPSPARLAFLAACPNLRSITIRSVHAEPTLNALLALPAVHSVHHVRLDTPLHVKNLSLCLMTTLWTNLQHLHINAGAGAITPELIATLSLQPNLRSLTLLGCQAIASTEWGALACLHPLSALHLANVKHLPFLTLATLLAPLPHLASLTLTACHLYHEPADPRNPIALAPLRALRTLHLDRTTGFPASALLSPAAPLTLRHLALPASLPHSAALLPGALPLHLTHLDLSRNLLPPAALPPLALPLLAHLDLSHTCAAPSPADLLPAAATLTHLDLSHCTLTPPTFHTALPHLTRLTHLAFSAAPDSLAPLAPLTALRVIHAPALSLDRDSAPPLAALPLLHTLTVRAIALWPNLPPLAALTSLTATAAHKFSDFDFCDVAAVTTPRLASLTLHNASSLTPDAIPNLIHHLPSLASLSLTGLFALPPHACALICAHPVLQGVTLAFPAAPPQELQELQDHLEACQLDACCCNELPVAP